MKKLDWRFVLILIITGILGWVWAAAVLKGQEVDPNKPRTIWQAAFLSPDQNLWYGGTRVDVVDTTGVCLYVARWNNGIALQAVPKTQLPKGVGCQ